jgi:hypothetical protein
MTVQSSLYHTPTFHTSTKLQGQIAYQHVQPQFSGLFKSKALPPAEHKLLQSLNIAMQPPEPTGFWRKNRLFRAIYRAFHKAPSGTSANNVKNTYPDGINPKTFVGHIKTLQTQGLLKRRYNKGMLLTPKFFKHVLARVLTFGNTLPELPGTELLEKQHPVIQNIVKFALAQLNLNPYQRLLDDMELSLTKKGAKYLTDHPNASPVTTTQ